MWAAIFSRTSTRVNNYFDDRAVIQQFADNAERERNIAIAAAVGLSALSLFLVLKVKK